MRIVIDLQGAQTESRFRGIGRYSMSLTQAIVRNRGDHEIVLALSGFFPDTIEPIRAAFDGMLPQENIQVWYAPGPTREVDPSNHHRRETAERIREAFLQSLNPDVVLVTSLFEGFGDNAVTSVGVFDAATPVAVILYDLIPLINPDIHFKTNKLRQDYYARKITSLRRSQRILAISSSARQEAIDTLGCDEKHVINISCACDTSFKELGLTDAEKEHVCSKYNIRRSFIMYTGGADERKNLPCLIEAYAQLSSSVRKIYQLVFVGKMPEESIDDFLATAKKSGLAGDELVLTGYVEDADLVRLYNCCSLFVFPSLHEGFGIPPLEAMLCGAPVIASNATSLPEVIGRGDALFDPRSSLSISAKINHVLSNDQFRKSLIAHGQAHARTFSWDESAQRALAALQDFDHGPVIVGRTPLCIEKTTIFRKQHKKILLIKLDHMGDFFLAMPALAKLKARYPYASIDIVLGSWNESMARELKMFDNIYVFDYFKKKSSDSATAGESEIDALLEKLGDYDFAIDLRRQEDTRFLLVRTRAKLKVGYETSEKAINCKIDILVRSYPDVPHETTPLNRTPITMQMLKLIESLPDDINDYVSLPEIVQAKHPDSVSVAIFPNAGNDVKEWGRSNYLALIDALERDSHINAINVYFASTRESTEFGLESRGKLRVHSGLDLLSLVNSLSENSICIANNSLGAHLGSYLGLMVIGIYGGHETVKEWAPVFGNSYVISASAACSPCHIPMQSDCTNGMFCLSEISVAHVYNIIVEAVQSVNRIRHNDSVDRALMPTITLKKNSDNIVEELVSAIVNSSRPARIGDESIAIAKSISGNHPPASHMRQLLVDISELVKLDAKSGIQRVVRSVLAALLANPPKNCRVQPVYAHINEPGYRYARQFTLQLAKGNSGNGSVDDLVEAYNGDIFLGLDLHPQVVPAQKDFLERWRQRGIRIYFMVYDLLPVMMPQFFEQGTHHYFHRWLQTVSRFDGAVCISQTTAHALKEWLDVFGDKRLRPFMLAWSHIGSDVANSVPTTGLPENSFKVLKALNTRPTFLSVGTIEPRKGQQQILTAFEQLWREAVDVNLTFVGKQGWMMETFLDRVKHHPELDKRLFWLQGISDEYLEKVYAASTCLISASEGEGFGLPLIEAAQHGRPIIARDLPIFREVAGEHAYYFSGETPEALADAVKQWMVLYKAGKHPASDDMPRLTWGQSTQQLLGILFEGKWQQQWRPDGIYRYWGADPRYATRVGVREGKDIVTTNQAGHLLYGPYLHLPAGYYNVSVYGTLDADAGGEKKAHLDVAIEKGKRILAESFLSKPDRHGCLASLDFTLDKSCTDIEARIMVGPQDKVRISMVCIKPGHQSLQMDADDSLVHRSVATSADRILSDQSSVEIKADSKDARATALQDKEVLINKKKKHKKKRKK